MGILHMGVIIIGDILQIALLLLLDRTLVLLRRTEGADEKIAEGLPAVIGEVAGSGAGKRI